MPILRNAYKALRQSKKRSERNLMTTSDIKTLLKKTRKAIDEKSPDVEDMLKDSQKKIEKAVKKGIFKKNTGGRKLSRLMKYYHQGGRKIEEKVEKMKEEKEKKKEGEVQEEK